MTRAEATCKLAERVMGATIHRDDFDETVIAGFPDGSRYYLSLHPTVHPSILAWWNPWTNTQQALDLAEAWRAAGDTDRRWKLHSPTTGDKFIVIVDILDKLPPDDGCVVVDDAPAAALTGAVCKAVGIEVEEA